jgi:SAM-dependent methyltransferase
MLNLLEKKAKRLSEQVRSRITIKLMDILKADWPSGFDLVIMGGNCFYELGSIEEQQHIIRAAYQALKPGGFLFTDGDCMDGLLDESWCHVGVEDKAFPSGICEHGVRLQGYSTTTAVDRENRIWKAHRRVVLEYPDGRQEETHWDETVHPTSVAEVRTWIEESGFEIREAFAGTKTRNPLKPDSKRATFWAMKPQ